MPAVLMRSPYALTKPPPGSQIDWLHPLSRGLLGAWDGLESGGVSAFNSVVGPVGVFGSAAKYGAETRGSAWKFDGTVGSTNSYIEVTGADITIYDFGLKHYAIEVWFKASSNSNTQYLVSSQDIGGANGWWTNLSSTGALLFGHSTSASGFTQITTTRTFFDGNWHHAVFVRDGALHLLKIYVDGVLDTSGGDGSRNVATTSGHVYIGASFFTSVPARSLNGAMAYARIWRDRLITPADVQQLYQEPFAMLRGPDVYRRYWDFGASASAAGLAALRMMMGVGA